MSAYGYDPNGVLTVQQGYFRDLAEIEQEVEIELDKLTRDRLGYASVNRGALATKSLFSLLPFVSEIVIIVALKKSLSEAAASLGRLESK